MGTCCSTGFRRKQKDENDILEEDYQLKNPKTQCEQKNKVYALCKNVDCTAPDIIICNQKLCQTCPQHDDCDKLEINDLTKQLRKRLDRHKQFLSKLTDKENKLIDILEDKKNERIQKILLNGVEGEFRKIIQGLYFHKNIDQKQIKKYSGELLHEVDKSYQLEVIQQEIIDKYNKQTEQLVKDLKFQALNSVMRHTNSCHEQQQLHSRKIKQYGYSDITNKLKRMRNKEEAVELTINNTCNYIPIQAYLVFDQAYSIITPRSKSKNMQCKFTAMKLVRNINYQAGKQIVIKEYYLVYLEYLSINLVRTQSSTQLQNISYQEYMILQLRSKHKLIKGIQQKNIGQIKPFAEQLTKYTKLETLIWIFSHDIYDQDFFQDILETLNTKLERLKNIKVHLPPGSSIKDVNDTWLRFVREDVEVQLIKYETKKSKEKKKDGKV